MMSVSKAAWKIFPVTGHTWPEMELVSAELSKEKPEMPWSIRSTEILNENPLYLIGIAVVPFSEQIASWACGRQAQADTFNMCFWKSPWTRSVPISAFKTFKNQILEKLLLLSELSRALKNLPVYHGAKCSVEVQVCSEFSSKRLEGIPGFAKQAVLEARHCPSMAARGSPEPRDGKLVTQSAGLVPAWWGIQWHVLEDCTR